MSRAREAFELEYGYWWGSGGASDGNPGGHGNLQLTGGHLGGNTGHPTGQPACGGHPPLDVDFKAVCDAVSRARNGNGETVTEVAERFGVSRGWIYKVGVQGDGMRQEIKNWILTFRSESMITMAVPPQSVTSKESCPETCPP